MNHLNFWQHKTNPETGMKFEAFRSYLDTSHNGNGDIDAFISSPYGKKLTELLETRFTYEEDPMGDACLSYYHSMGLTKEMHDDEDYYTRWASFIPDEAIRFPEKKYPLVFMNHGGSNPIEVDEFSPNLLPVAGREKFMVICLQNTNWENLLRVLDEACHIYPVDTERVYLTGYSQGGYQVTSTYFRAPERFAAAAPCGNDIYRTYDNFNIPYTPEETRNLTETFLPFMQMVGECEASCFVPLNDWAPRKDWGPQAPKGKEYTPPRRNDAKDPTRIIGGRRPFSDMPVPPEGTDRHLWMISRLNMRMATLGCVPRDAKRCLSFLDTPEDELHHILGFYGDQEQIQTFYGYKHYRIDIYNKEHINAFRYIAVENCPHWPFVTMGELIWDFFRQFRRDSRTKRIIIDPYSA